VLISRTARDLEDTIVSLLSSPANRERLSRRITSATEFVGSSAAGRDDNAAGEIGASMNAALRLAYEATMLGYARVLVAEGGTVRV
jgi:hypothetical protein